MHINKEKPNTKAMRKFKNLLRHDEIEPRKTPDSIIRVPSINILT